MLPYLIAGAIGFVVGKLLEEDEAPKYADGGEINYGSPKVNMSDIPFIHETTKEIADKILKEGFIVSKNDNITKGVYTIPIVYKKEPFNGQEIEIEVLLKPNSKIFWTNTKRPNDFYYGVGNNFFNDLFIKLGGNINDNNRIVFLRNMEKWLSNNGYCGVQQGGEIVITDLSCIESIQQFERHNPDIRFDNGGEADEPTNFWGTEAGGVLVYCSTTERYLILLRSEWVLEPNTWGIISGKLDDDETNIEDAVLRESEEETGHKLGDLIPSFIFEKPNFKFHNFVSIIEKEFVPELNWENTDYKWVKLNEMPDNLHFGLKLLLQKEDMQTLVKKNKNNTMNKYNPTAK